MAIGTATLNFGAAPGSQFASVAVTGQTGILTTSNVEAFMMSETSADNTEMVHRIAPVVLRCGTISAGVGFTIYAYCQWNLSNTMTVRWVWA